MIGRMIQQKRKEVGLTQAQLAELLGVTPPAVNRWEKDLSFPDTTLLAPLARCLKTDLNTLFSFYDSLSDKERTLILNKSSMLLLSGSTEDAMAFMDAALKQNLSDGALYKEMADMLSGIYAIVQPDDPSFFFVKIAEYYERALVLLPEAAADISHSLIAVYGKLGNAAKAEEAWSRLEYAKYDKKWAHAELLYLLKDYDHAIPEIKELILRQVFELSGRLYLLSDALTLSGNKALADVAADTEAQLRNIFGLWHGHDLINRAKSAIETQPAEVEKISLGELLRSDVTQDQLSTCPLFADVTLGGRPSDESTSVDLLADVLTVMQKLQKKET